MATVFNFVGAFAGTAVATTENAIDAAEDAAEAIERLIHWRV